MIESFPYSRAAQALEVIRKVESEIGSRFYGLENITAKGPRKWSIAPRPPHAAIDAITGHGAPQPDHVLVRWSADCHAWRKINLTTVKRIWWTGRDGTKREAIIN